ncbi:hypothetical protein ACQEWB_39465 [Streptomyces sp. CA-249302]|uniref:hypothetical protein n=1 Tax=Streptomyces sp. CA-249302 TaxID=3240058 RepID=UPI003D8C1D81
MIPRRIALPLVGLASALLLAACGSSDGDGGTGAVAPATSAPVTSAPDTSAPETSAPAAGGTPSGAQTETTTLVAAKAMQGMGNVVTDDKGLTLYRFDNDEPNPSKWTCSGTCTKTWLPVIVQEDSVPAEGVDQSLLGVVHRNGERQVTLGGWPLYRYVGDTAAGQANGQGKDAKWYAVAPSGQKAAATG